MNKNTFLKILKKQLRCLNSSERQKNINYYDEMIADLIENGFSEENAVKKIGSPKQLAQEIIENTSPENMKKTDWIGRILIGMCFLTILLSAISRIRMYLHSKETITIIGGADGPTSIFLAGRIGHFPRMWMIAAIVVIITVIYFLWKRRKRT